MLFESWIFKDFRVYAFFEVIIGLVVLMFTLRLYLLWKQNKSSTLQSLIFYYSLYIIAIGFAALSKFVWATHEGPMDATYGLLLIDESIFVYFFTILANTLFSNYIRKMFSRKHQFYDTLIFSYSTILLICLFIPLFYTIFLKILILLQSLSIYLPAMVKSYRYVKHTKKDSKKIMLGVFKFSLMHNMMWLCNVLDGLWDIITDIYFGPLYYCIWISALIAIYFAYKGNFNLDYHGLISIDTDDLLIPTEERQKLKETVQTEALDMSEEHLLLSCPACGESSYYKVTPELQTRCKTSSGQLITIFIRSGVVCDHAFIAYIDKHLDVRGYERLDYTHDVDLLFNHLPDLFFHISYDTTILDIFGNTKELFEPKEKSIGKKIVDLLPKSVSEKAQPAIEQAITQKTNTLITYSLTVTNQQQLYEARFIPTSQKTVLAIIRNITAQKKTEDLLLKEQLKSEKIESLALLAGGIAHDFNNLLVSILGNVDLLHYEDGLSKEGKEILEDLEQAGFRAKNLTQQLMTFAKQGSAQKEMLSIVKILQEAISLTMRGSKSKAEMILTAKIPDVEIDAGQVNQVFSNLLINAKQAMPKGGKITIPVSLVNISENSGISLPAGKYVLISIQDQGVGIPLDQQEHIFEPYHTTKTQGNGLGLASCFSIMKNHHGHITFESEINKGTTFSVYFPLLPNN